MTILKWKTLWSPKFIRKYFSASRVNALCYRLCQSEEIVTETEEHGPEGAGVLDKHNVNDDAIMVMVLEVFSILPVTISQFAKYSIKLQCLFSSASPMCEKIRNLLIHLLNISRRVLADRPKNVIFLPSLRSTLHCCSCTLQTKD